MDKLKDYIQHHKENLNFDEPSSKVWAAIEEQVTSSKQKPTGVYSIMHIVKWVVAACIITLAGFGLKNLLKNDEHNNSPTVVSIQTNTTQPIITANSNNNVSNDKIKIEKAKQPIIKSDRKNDNTIEVLKEIDNRFVQIVNYQKSKINNTPLYAENANYFLAFKEQMQELDKDEIVIRKKIKTDDFNMEFLDALVTIYQQKIDVLKSLQTEINKLNNRYKQNQGPVDTTGSYFIHI